MDAQLPERSGTRISLQHGDNHAVGVVFMLAPGGSPARPRSFTPGRCPSLFAGPFPGASRRSRRSALGRVVSYIRIGYAQVDFYRDEHISTRALGFLCLGNHGPVYAGALLFESDYPRRYGWSL